MRRTLTRAAALFGLVLGSAALAQPPQAYLPQPRVTSAFPCGAKAGTTTDITVNGTDLDDADELLFSHPGIKAEVIHPPEPKDPKADAKKAPPQTGRRRGGAPAASVKFKVTVAADVPAGQYDVRIANRFGVSNPRAFVVGTLPEVDEIEPNDDAFSPDPSAALAGGMTVIPGRGGPKAQRIELGTTVNGVIGAPTDVDYTVFAGKAGQRVLASCLASSIDSRARPLVEVYDPTGRRLGLSRNYNGTDALADVTLPSDGDYYVRVSEFAYQQGGPDYFYRLTIGTGPWIDAVFPPMVNPGKPVQLTVFGRNLPGGKLVLGALVEGRPIESVVVTVTPPTDPAARTKFAYRGRVAPPSGILDAFEFRLPGSNGVPVLLTDAKVYIEKESGNDRPETAEAIPVPCEVAGRIDRRYDRDYYSFAAKKGDVYYIELTADRIGGLSDLYLRVRDDKGKDLAGELDDDNDSLHPTTFFTRSSDPPAYKFTAPADGTYLLLVGGNDANVSFGPRCGYRLRVSAPAPDFRAVVMARGREMPTTLVALAEGEAAFDVFVHRADGFSGPVTVTAENLPAGVTAKPALVGSGMRWGTLVLSAAAGAKEFTGPVSVKCAATIAGKPVVREARPATITWGIPGQQGNNVPMVTRLDQQLVVAVRPEKASFRLAADLATATVKTKDKDGKDKDEKVTGPIYVKPGDKLTLPVKVTWQEKDARANPVNVFLEATQPNMQQAPLGTQGGGNNNPFLTIVKDKNDAQATIDVRSQAAPGTYAVVLRGETQIQYVRDPAMKDKKAPVTATAFAQPIEITVLPTTLAKVTVQPPAALKPGGTADLVVKVERQNDYAGEFKVTVTLPKDTKGVTAKDVTIPAGVDEVKVPVAVAKDAKPGGVPNVAVSVTATVHGKFPVTTETKVNLTVAK